VVAVVVAAAGVDVALSPDGTIDTVGSMMTVRVDVALMRPWSRPPLTERVLIDGE
jgi:hypothetical protein